MTKTCTKKLLQEIPFIVGIFCFFSGLLAVGLINLYRWLGRERLFHDSDSSTFTIIDFLASEAHLVHTLLILIAALSASVISYFLLVKKIARPLEQLHQAAREAESGLALQPAAPGSLESEISHASIVFGSMTRRLTDQHAAMIASDARYQLLFENAKDALFIVCPALKIHEVNNAALSMSGYSAEELLEENFSKLIRADLRAEFQARVDKLNETGKAESIEIFLQHKYIGVFEVIVWFMQFTYREQSSFILLTLQDVSLQRESERKNKSQLRHLQTLHEISKKIASTLHLEELYQSIYAEVVKVIPADVFSIELYHDSTDQIQHVYSVVSSNGKVHASFPVKYLRPTDAVDREVLGGRTIRINRKYNLPSRVLTPQHNLPEKPESAVFAPMISRDKKIGLISVQSFNQETYDHEHTELLTAIAYQAGLAIENATFYQAINEYAASLRILQSLTSVFYQELNYHSLLNLIVRNAWKAVAQVETALLMLIDPQHGTLEISAAHGFRDADRLLNKKFKIRAGFFHDILQKKQGRIFQQGKSGAKYLTDEAMIEHWRQANDQFPPMSVLCVPLLSQKGAIGLLAVENYQNRHAFNWKDITFFQSLANQGAIAIENTHLIREIQQSQRDFQNLIDYAGLIIIGTENDGRITIFNRMAAEVTACPVEQALGRRVQEKLKFSESDREYALNLIHGALNSNQMLLDVEFEVLGVKEQRRSIVWNSSPLLMAGGERRGLLIIGLDITDKKKLEMQLTHSQKMESIGTLAGGVAHDFNNLLTGILGYSSYLLSKLKPGDPFQREIAMIEKSAAKAGELTAQLLAFGRRKELKKNPVDVNQLIEDTLNIFRRTFSKSVEIEYQAELPLSIIEADEAQIQQVLMNLGINARDALKGGGKLLISASPVSLNSAYCRNHPECTPGNYIRVSFEDNGCGMDAETLKRVFDPFFTTKPVGEGTGLGMSIVYGIVKDHGGHIEIESALSVGTMTTIYLPVHEQTAQLELQPGQFDMEAARGNENILIVDDEEVVVGLAANILHSSGYGIFVAPNGMDALEIFREYVDAIDLVVLDLVMPGISGREVFMAMQELNPEIRVLIASGFSAQDTVEELKRLGIAGFLPKPYRIDQLLSEVRRILDAPPPAAELRTAQTVSAKKSTDS